MTSINEWALLADNIWVNIPNMHAWRILQSIYRQHLLKTDNINKIYVSSSFLLSSILFQGPHRPPTPTPQNLLNPHNSLAARPWSMTSRSYRANHVPIFILCALPLLSPSSSSSSSSPLHHDHTVTVTARTHWSGADAFCRRGSCAYETWLDICWERGGSCCVTRCWLRGRGEGDEDGRETDGHGREKVKSGRRTERRGEMRESD